jgi:hypothetical protein
MVGKSGDFEEFVDISENWLKQVNITIEILEYKICVRIYFDQVKFETVWLLGRQVQTSTATWILNRSREN